MYVRSRRKKNNSESGNNTIHKYYVRKSYELHTQKKATQSR